MMPLDNSTINNAIVLNADLGADVGGGINATWAGPISGTYGLVKNGAGTLTLTNANNNYSGNTIINAGNLVINGPLQINAGQAVDVAGGTLTLNNNVVNNGLFVVENGAHIAGSSGSFINNGVFDIMTAGNFTFPPGFVNHGTIVDKSVVKVASAQKSGTTFTTTISGYSYHTYQLQYAPSLNSTFVNVGPAQQGTTGTVLTFTDSNASAATGFYRIAVD
jgi:autotransporter-associated beta strand protein